MVLSAAQGFNAATMLPWVAPEVLRTPELVTGKASKVLGWAGTDSRPALACSWLERLAPV